VTSLKPQVSILDRIRRVMQGNILQRAPLWFSVVQRYPPPVFYRQPRPKPVELKDEEVYEKFFTRYPDPKLQDALFTGKRNPRMVYLKRYPPPSWPPSMDLLLLLLLDAWICGCIEAWISMDFKKT